MEGSAAFAPLLVSFGAARGKASQERETSSGETVTEGSSGTAGPGDASTCTPLLPRMARPSFHQLTAALSPLLHHRVKDPQ